MIKNRGAKLLSALVATALAATSVVALGGVANAASTITLWAPSSAAGENPYKKVATLFEAKYPQYKVEFKELAAVTYPTALSTALQGGNGPDVFKTAPGQGAPDSVVTLAKAKLLLDISSTGAAKINPVGSRANLGIGNKTYGLGLEVGAGTMVANYTLLKEEGFSWPTNYAGLLKLCTAAKAKGRVTIAIAAGVVRNLTLAVSAMAQNTYSDQTWVAKRFAGKVNFANDLGWRRTMEQFVEMEKAGCFQDGAIAHSEPQSIDTYFKFRKAYAVFVPGNLSTQVARFWPPLAEAKDQVVTTYFPPVVAGKGYVPMSVNYAFSANAKTKQSAAVRAFINFAATKAGQSGFQAINGGLPLDGSGTVPASFAPIVPFIKAGRTYENPNNTYTNAKVADILGKGIQGMLTGQTAPSKVLKAMDSAW